MPQTLQSVYPQKEEVRYQKMFFWKPLLPRQLRRRCRHTFKSVQTVMAVKCPSIVPFKIIHSEEPFEVVSFKQSGFGTTLQYGDHGCFDSEVPFRGRFIPFAMQA